jgi:GST-like protein
LQVQEYSHLQRWTKQLLTRPGVQRGRIVNKVWGEEEKQLKERHSANDFKGRV